MGFWSLRSTKSPKRSSSKPRPTAPLRSHGISLWVVGVKDCRPELSPSWVQPCRRCICQSLGKIPFVGDLGWYFHGGHHPGLIFHGVSLVFLVISMHVCRNMCVCVFVLYICLEYTYAYVWGHKRHIIDLDLLETPSGGCRSSVRCHSLEPKVLTVSGQKTWGTLSRATISTLPRRPARRRSRTQRGGPCRCQGSYGKSVVWANSQRKWVREWSAVLLELWHRCWCFFMPVIQRLKWYAKKSTFMYICYQM